MAMRRLPQERRMKAIGIIRDEHRALAAVLHGLLYLVREVRDRGAAPNFPVLSAMIYYIDAFPERFHHPKEDRYLFPLVRARAPSVAGTLDRLEAEHHVGAAKMRTLMQALTRYREGGPDEAAAFIAAVEDYIAFERDHMGREEREILPAAQRHLTAGDWEAVDAAFSGSTDPLLGTTPETHWAQVFSRIANLAPPPIGVGPAQAA
jgi:hemerythrin-like domain-containing protein